MMTALRFSLHFHGDCSWWDLGCTTDYILRPERRMEKSPEVSLALTALRLSATTRALCSPSVGSWLIVRKGEWVEGEKEGRGSDRTAQLGGLLDEGVDALQVLEQLPVVVLADVVLAHQVAVEVVQVQVHLLHQLPARDRDRDRNKGGSGGGGETDTVQRRAWRKPKGMRNEEEKGEK